MGASDCEGIGQGLLAQPVNTLSSIAFVLAGVWIVYRALGSSIGRARMVLFGMAVASVGVGSILYHGPQPGEAQLVHDGTIAIVVAGVAALELMRGRRGVQRDRDGYLLALAALLLGAVAFTFGRTNSPLCSPGDVLQLHALWHVLAALALIAYASAERWAPGKGRPGRQRTRRSARPSSPR
ncbi:MAG: ceramidase domain-containing protein [Actinomycetota bacterium]